MKHLTTGILLSCAAVLAACTGETSGTVEQKPATVPPPVQTDTPSTASLPERDYAYDENWNEAPYWPGEYPMGIYVIEADAMIMARTAPKPELASTVKCPLEEKAAYHPWNGVRNIALGLQYKTITRSVTFTTTQAVTITIYGSTGAEGTQDRPQEIEPGTQVAYLGYIGEGAGMFKVGGIEFEENVGVFGSDVDVLKGPERSDQWLGLPCAGEQGWILLDDVRNIPGVIVGVYAIRNYGEVTDLTDDEVQDLISKLGNPPQ